jgi:zinc protease
MLYNISNYNYADDYAKQQEKIVKNSTLPQIKQLANDYLNQIK